MKRSTAMLLMVLAAAAAAAQQPPRHMFRVSAGAAFPSGAAEGAPVLSASFHSSLRAAVAPDGWPMALSLSVDAVRWLSSPRPDRSAVPIDDGLYVKRAVHFPLLVGLWVPLCDGRRVACAANVGLGAYWRNLNLLRMAAPGVMDDMEESGWGVAGKVEVEAVLGGRWSLGAAYLLVGSPFGRCGDPPAGTGSVVDGVRRSKPTLDGYGQGFLTLTVGYHIL